MIFIKSQRSLILNVTIKTKHLNTEKYIYYKIIYGEHMQNKRGEQTQQEGKPSCLAVEIRHVTEATDL